MLEPILHARIDSFNKHLFASIGCLILGQPKRAGRKARITKMSYAILGVTFRGIYMLLVKIVQTYSTVSG